MPFPKGGSRGSRKRAVAARLSAGLCLLAFGVQPAVPQEDPWARPTLNFMGVPGLLDMPTAHPMPDADLNLTIGMFEKTRRGTMHFQITPRISGVFRYANLEDFRTQDQYYDRSFDLRFLLAEEGRYSPAVTVGLQDIGGSGIYAGEYLVATKTFGRLRATGGIGWGRFGSYNGFTNPLGILSSKLETRPAGNTDITETGRLDAEHWFRGDAAFFGGLQYAASDRLLLSAEYSSDGYDAETADQGFERDSPYNFGLTYRIRDNVDLRAAWLYGTTAAVQLTYTFNPKTPNAYPGGFDRAPTPVLVRDPGSVTDLGWTQQPDAEAILRDNMRRFLTEDEMELERFGVDARTARVWIRTGRQISEAQAVGRAGRMMTQVLPASVERFEITLVSQNGLPVTRVVLMRSDIEELEHAPDGAWQSFARATLEDAHAAAGDTVLTEGAFPKFDWQLGPYLSATYFDPDSPVRLSFGAQLGARYEPVAGLVLEGNLRKELTENTSDLRPSNSVLPRVRSDNARYAEAADVTLNTLTATQYFRPGENLFGRVTAGYLEPMYGGLSGEILWQPVDSRLGLGLEVNYAQQREFSQGFGFQDYGVVTGHASAYYQGLGGFRYQVDVGRYLAKDWGGTFGIDREFDNGIRIGAFATFTDVSFDDFGEGSFDKGIRLHIPLSALTGQRSEASISRTIRPVQRDGGARLEVDTRLYEQVRQYQQPALQGQWGRFWR